ncbi:MAG: helix-turn-helix domain-containing protein [Bdellovibrionaceae bacterium]|nr:helix-turn-helix domain-containing protein [Pseudobdellovibrionaceae bacterium]
MDSLWDIRKVMHYLGVGKDWVYQRVSSGELNSIRLGKYIRFDPRDVEQLVNNCKVRSLKTKRLNKLENQSRRSTKGDLWQK